MKKITTLLAIALLAVSCASNDKKNEKNPFDALTLKEVLIEGKTSFVTQRLNFLAFGNRRSYWRDDYRFSILLLPRLPLLCSK